MSELKKYEVFARIVRIQSVGIFEAENPKAALKLADENVDWLDVLHEGDEDDPVTYVEEVGA